jgi:hypothetical protein
MTLEQVESASTIASIFEGNAARQKSESHYFSRVTGPARPDRSKFLPAPSVNPKFTQGPAGRLPYFKMADHLL